MSDDEVALENYLNLTEETENPLYIWDAIRSSNLDEPLPHWIRLYLLKVSSNIYDLIPEDAEFNASKLMEKIPYALMLTRKGFNAFKDDFSNSRKKALAVWEIIERDKGETQAKVLEEMPFKGLPTDVRKRRQLVQQGHKLLVASGTPLRKRTKPRGNAPK